ncbi:hypothetical protein TSOC_004883 [Tetrabaena socialis]|uniref:Uncharacterized protein n=1 Tax=Tetrabaena socialis TaxID=47790 RepID=A0A2J8A7V3_9CHLO|nr:hypothetical protein TSOC_004883 [Tetrabaena socialis]|eukprot:PNH08553.1 hypothetical protein TSOC_004883 [Tetrabaena socialis]
MLLVPLRVRTPGAAQRGCNRPHIASDTAAARRHEANHPQFAEPRGARSPAPNADSTSAGRGEALPDSGAASKPAHDRHVLGHARLSCGAGKGLLRGNSLSSEARDDA